MEEWLARRGVCNGAGSQRAALRGLAVLQDATAEAVSALDALAEARARNIVLPRAALLPVEPYLLAFLDARRAEGGEAQQNQQDEGGVPAGDS